MEPALFYVTYHHYVPQLDALIERQAKGGASVTVPFGEEAIAELVSRDIPEERAVRLLSFFFQLRRAFYFIERSLAGECPSMQRLREALWNNVFTHDMRGYEAALWSRMKDFSTLLLGETGTGKGQAATAIGRSEFIPYLPDIGTHPAINLPRTSSRPTSKDSSNDRRVEMESVAKTSFPRQFGYTFPATSEEEGMHKLFAVALGLISIVLCGGALAQQYPTKPVKLIVTYPPGGSSDLMARVFGQKLGEVWGQTVVIESKPGAAGSIGMDFAAKQAPDGYSFVVGNIGPAAVNPLLSKVPYDIQRDFVAISLISTGPNILIVHPNVPAKSLRGLTDYAKSNSGKLNYGTSGPGSISHLAGAMYTNLTGVKATEVPYKGGILGVQDLVAGHIQYIFSDSLPAMEFIKAGRARALCVTSAERSPIMPELPPCAESVPGLVAVNWWGVFMPAGTPKAITDKFHTDLVKVMQDADVKQKFADMGVEAIYSTPERFVAFMKSETAKYAKLIKEAGIKVE